MAGQPILTYLDTSALMRKAESIVPNPTPRNLKILPIVDGIIADRQRVIACSEITILEYYSNLATQVRDYNFPDCDLAWWQNARAMFFELVESTNMQVLPYPPKAAEHALLLIHQATHKYQRALKSWDAMHAIVAGKWAIDSGQNVEIITTDAHLEIPLRVTKFDGLVTIVNLDVLAGTGEGLDGKKTKAQ